MKLNYQSQFRWRGDSLNLNSPTPTYMIVKMCLSLKIDYSHDSMIKLNIYSHHSSSTGLGLGSHIFDTAADILTSIFHEIHF